MAGEVSKKDMGSVLMQVMMAAKNVRAQRDRLLQLQRRLQRLQADADKQDKLGDLASDLFRVYYVGLEAGAHMLMTCIRLALQKGARFAPDMALALTPDEQLHDALLAHQLPPRPTTQAQGLARVMAAVLAVKLLEEHLLPRCVECLVGGKAPVPGMTPDSSPDSSPDRDHDDPDPVAAATKGLARVDLSADDPDATASAKTGGKPTRDGDAASGGGEVEKALDYLYRACRIASLAVKHSDVAVAVLSRFVDPKDAARLAEFSDARAYISEDGPYPTSD